MSIYNLNYMYCSNVQLIMLEREKVKDLFIWWVILKATYIDYIIVLGFIYS